MTTRVGIYFFPDVEVLDFAGPYEVFTTASRVFLRQNPSANPPFEVFTLSEGGSAIKARAGLNVLPDQGIDQHPPIDLLIIPGGIVTAERGKPAVIQWIATQARQTRLTASICTGAFLLAETGLLQDRKATTHWEDLADLQHDFPEIQVVADCSWVDEGDIITSGGISAGIDMSLHLVERLAGPDLALATARQMAFRWRRENESPLRQEVE